MTMLELMILINFAVWLIRNVRYVKAGIKNRLAKKAGVIEYPFGIEMILVLVVGLIGVAVAGFTNEALGTWKAYFFEPILFLIVIYQVVGRLDLSLEEKYKKLVLPLMISGLVVSALAIYQKITGQLIDNPLWQASATRRVVSVFGYPNAVGLYLETIVIYCFGLLALVIARSKTTKQSQVNKIKTEIATLISFTRNDRAKILFYLISLSSSLVAIIFAKSNGAALGLVVGFSLFAILYSKRSRLFFCSFVFLLASLIFSLHTTSAGALEYLTLNDFSGQVRLIGWQESWQMLANGHLLTGVGLSNFQKAVAPYHVPGFYFNKNHDPDFHRKLVLFDQNYREQFWQPLEIYMYPHNILLNFWSETGLLGLLIFVWLMAKFYYFSIRCLEIGNWKLEILEQKKLRIIILTSISAMSTIIAHGLVDVPFFKNDLAVLFWLPILFMGLYQLELEAVRIKTKS